MTQDKQTMRLGLETSPHHDGLLPRLPGQADRVAVVCQTATMPWTLSALLDPLWEVIPYTQIAGCLDDLTHEVVVIIEPDLSVPAFLDCADVIAEREGHLCPIIICTSVNAENMACLARLPSVRVVVMGEGVYRTLRCAVDQAREEGLFREVLNRIHSLPGVPPLLSRAVRRAILQSPPSCVEAIEILEKGGPVYARTVTDFAVMLGCHPGYLARAAANSGIGLGRLLRWVTFLRGMSLRKATSAPWAEIAVRLGFPSHPAWTNFSKRLVGMSPREAEKVGLDDWMARCIESVFHGE